MAFGSYFLLLPLLLRHTLTVFASLSSPKSLTTIKSKGQRLSPLILQKRKEESSFSQHPFTLQASIEQIRTAPCFFPGRSRREAAGGKCCVNRSNCLRSHLFTSNAAKNTQSNSTLGRDETLREPLVDGCSCPEVTDTHCKP